MKNYTDALVEKEVEDTEILRVIYRNGDGRMEDIDSYAEDYGFKATKIDSYKNPYYLEWDEASPMMDEWLLEGSKDDIMSFMEDYCLPVDEEFFEILA
jgi:hypothetical protein